MTFYFPFCAQNHLHKFLIFERARPAVVIQLGHLEASLAQLSHIQGNAVTLPMEYLHCRPGLSYKYEKSLWLLIAIPQGKPTLQGGLAENTVWAPAAPGFRQRLDCLQNTMFFETPFKNAINSASSNLFIRTNLLRNCQCDPVGIGHFDVVETFFPRPDRLIVHLPVPLYLHLGKRFR